jgi:hypothetical protein
MALRRASTLQRFGLGGHRPRGERNGDDPALRRRPRQLALCPVLESGLLDSLTRATI